jgi:DNA-binding transcriptional ArsR family regulator
MALVLLAASNDDAPAETRRRILSAVQQFPGLPAADLARQTKTSAQLMDYHLHALIRSGLVSNSDDATSTYFAAEGEGQVVVDRRDRILLSTVRRPMGLRIALQLLEFGSISMGDLARNCGISPATATHHVKRMAKAEAVAVKQEGRGREVALTDPTRMRRLLVDHPPPRDMVAGFIELWDRLDV